ncbi:hypothetical protein E4U54_000471 [Claviceps lovelessii]|nr:hypothetical protein E4U54_000471 [Claviceps lovelessii]
MSPARLLSTAIAPVVLRRQTASSSSSFTSLGGGIARALAGTACGGAVPVASCAGGYDGARTVSTRRQVRPLGCPLLPRGSIVFKQEKSTSSESGSSQAEAPVWKTWSFEEVKKVVDKKKLDPRSKEVVIIDVRQPWELEETGNIPGAVNMCRSSWWSFRLSDQDFQDTNGFERPSLDSHLLFYCKAGVRAEQAAKLAHDDGWDSVGVYHGSWLDWEARGGPVEKK